MHDSNRVLCQTNEDRLTSSKVRGKILIESKNGKVFTYENFGFHRLSIKAIEDFRFRVQHKVCGCIIPNIARKRVPFRPKPYSFLVKSCQKIEWLKFLRIFADRRPSSKWDPLRGLRPGSFCWGSNFWRSSKSRRRRPPQQPPRRMMKLEKNPWEILLLPLPMLSESIDGDVLEYPPHRRPTRQPSKICPIRFSRCGVKKRRNYNWFIHVRTEYVVPFLCVRLRPDWKTRPGTICSSPKRSRWRSFLMRQVATNFIIVIINTIITWDPLRSITSFIRIRRRATPLRTTFTRPPAPPPVRAPRRPVRRR